MTFDLTVLSAKNYYLSLTESEEKKKEKENFCLQNPPHALSMRMESLINKMRTPVFLERIEQERTKAKDLFSSINLPSSQEVEHQREEIKDPSCIKREKAIQELVNFNTYLSIEERVSQTTEHSSPGFTLPKKSDKLKKSHLNILAEDFIGKKNSFPLNQAKDLPLMQENAIEREVLLEGMAVITSLMSIPKAAMAIIHCVIEKIKPFDAAITEKATAEKFQVPLEKIRETHKQHPQLSSEGALIMEGLKKIAYGIANHLPISLRLIPEKVAFQYNIPLDNIYEFYADAAMLLIPGISLGGKAVLKNLFKKSASESIPIALDFKQFVEEAVPENISLYAKMMEKNPPQERLFHEKKLAIAVEKENPLQLSMEQESYRKTFVEALTKQNIKFNEDFVIPSIAEELIGNLDIHQHLSSLGKLHGGSGNILETTLGKYVKRVTTETQSNKLSVIVKYFDEDYFCTEVKYLHLFQNQHNLRYTNTPKLLWVNPIKGEVVLSDMPGVSFSKLIEEIASSKIEAYDYDLKVFNLVQASRELGKSLAEIHCLYQTPFPLASIESEILDVKRYYNYLKRELGEEHLIHSPEQMEQIYHNFRQNPGTEGAIFQSDFHTGNMLWDEQTKRLSACDFSNQSEAHFNGISRQHPIKNFRLAEESFQADFTDHGVNYFVGDRILKALREEYIKAYKGEFPDAALEFYSVSYWYEKFAQEDFH